MTHPKSSPVSRVYPGRVIFDHLAKTGGQAINAWLIGALGRGCVSPAIIGEHRRVIRKYGGNYSIICGHISFNPGDSLDPRYQYLTVLREPVSRVVSWIYFLLNHVTVDRTTARLVGGARAFLDSDGVESTPEFLESINNLATEHFSRVDHSCAMDDSARVATALNELERYRVVGLYEELPAFVDEVADLVCVPRPNGLPRVNTTEGKIPVAELSTGLRRRIEELNELDAALHLAVRNRGLHRRSTTLGIEQAPSAFPWRPYDGPPAYIVENAVSMLLASPSATHQVRVGERLNFQVDVSLSRTVSSLVLGIHVFDDLGDWAFGTNSQLLGQSHASVGPGRYRAEFSIVALLPTGTYWIGFAANENLANSTLQLAWYDRLCELQVVSDVDAPFAGYSYLHAQLSVEPLA